MIYTINEPNELLEFIESNIKPKEIEKKIRGEVFTHMKLVNEMLDKLPKNVWKNKNLKWLDPATGIGNFSIAIYMKLMDGLKNVINDIERRKKHILENMLYMVEINEQNCNMIKIIFCENTYKLNLFEGSFLDYKTNLMFDIVVGNPPFQNTSSEGERKALNHNLWSVFINETFKIINTNGYLLFITPISWMSPTSNNKDVFYNHYIVFLNIKECEKYF